MDAGSIQLDIPEEGERKKWFGLWWDAEKSRNFRKLIKKEILNLVALQALEIPQTSSPLKTSYEGVHACASDFQSAVRLKTYSFHGPCVGGRGYFGGFPYPTPCSVETFQCISVYSVANERISKRALVWSGCPFSGWLSSFLGFPFRSSSSRYSINTFNISFLASEPLPQGCLPDSSSSSFHSIHANSRDSANLIAPSWSTYRTSFGRNAPRTRAVDAWVHRFCSTRSFLSSAWNPSARYDPSQRASAYKTWHSSPPPYVCYLTVIPATSHAPSRRISPFCCFPSVNAGSTSRRIHACARVYS